jgi:hypothetical protein
MTNQSGSGAWRGYDVVSEFWLGWPRWAGATYSRIYRTAAVRACGARVADRSWVVIVQFPRAQSAYLGTSAAYLIASGHGLTIWRDQVVHP